MAHFPYRVYDTVGVAPPRPNARGEQAPWRRRLRIYTQDPSLSRLEGAVSTLSIDYEPLQVGPSGGVFVVEDFDEDAQRLYPGVDLDQPALLLTDGLGPSTTRREFAQQMVYAVAMETHACFRRALGRHLGFGPNRGDGRLRLQPRAFREANAYYDRERGAVKFGYERANRFAQGRSQPGGHVYTALSRDIVVHEVCHALLDGLRPNFLRPTHPDVGALHEGFADLVAIFLHFSQRSVVEQAIDRSGVTLDDALLVSMGRQFGFELADGRGPLRTAIVFDSLHEAVPKAHQYHPDKEEHALGAVLVSAVFEAFRSVFLRKTDRLRRVVASYQGRLPREAVELLAAEAARLAGQFLNITIRAIDYCPPSHCSLGEFLRAMITADSDMVGEDPWAYRETLVHSFRRYGIRVPGVADLSEDELLWKPPQHMPPIAGLRFQDLGVGAENGMVDWDSPESTRRAADHLARAVCASAASARQFGLVPPGGRYTEPELMSLRLLRRVAPDQSVRFDLVAEMRQKRQVREGWFFGGSTIVVGADGRVRYAMFKHVDSASRLAEQRAWLARHPQWAEAAWSSSSTSAARLQRRVHRERFR